MRWFPDAASNNNLYLILLSGTDEAEIPSATFASVLTISVFSGGEPSCGKSVGFLVSADGSMLSCS